MPATKPVGKPDAGNPHVRFDERGGETDRLRGTAPILDSTFVNGHDILGILGINLPLPLIYYSPALLPHASTNQAQ